MAADVTERLDLSLIFVAENAVVIDPAGELTGLLQLVNRGEVSEGPSTSLWDDDELCYG